MFYVYLLQNEIGSLYIGYTKDLRRRFKEHNNNSTQSTKGHMWKLVYYESYASQKDAQARELKLKHHGYGLRHLKSRLKQSLSKI